MQTRDKYSYSKYRKIESKIVRNSRIFVAPKIKFTFNPIFNLSPKFWGNIGIFSVLITGFWFIFFSNFFDIDEIIVEGNSLISQEDVASNIKIGENIFRFNLNYFEQKIILSNPIIEDVAIYRGVPNTLKVVILEKKPSIVWVSSEQNYLVDSSGTVDKKISNQEFADLVHIADKKNMPVKIGSQLLSEDFIYFVDRISHDFFTTTNLKLTEYYITETTFDLCAKTEAGFFVKFDTTRSFDKQLNDLKNILINYRENIHEYVDVRINGWGYYK
jgi:hypothetical protein